MKKGLKTLTLLISSIGAFNASADEQKNFYVQSNLGIAFGGYPGKDFKQNSFGNSGVYGLALGYKFTNHFRADFGVDYRDSFKNKWKHQKGYVTDTRETKVNSWTTMITGYFDIVEINKFTPYVFGGVGVARNSTESHGVAQHPNPSKPDTNYIFSKEDNINFAWKVGAGAKYEVNKNFDVGLNYQFVDLGKFRTGNVVCYSGNINGTEPHKRLEGKLKSHEITLNIIYKF